MIDHLLLVFQQVFILIYFDMVNLLLFVLPFIKTATAGTGGAYDAELSVLLIVSFLALILLIIVSIKFYKQKMLEYRKRKLFGSELENEDLDSEIEFFE